MAEKTLYFSNEKIVHFGETDGVIGIRLIASAELRRHFESRGESVPPWWVFAPYVEIGGESYAVVPIIGKDEPD